VEKEWLRFFLLFLYILLFGFLYYLTPNKEVSTLSLYFPKIALLPLIIAFLFHLYFWSFPIPTFEDIHAYCGVPALFLAKVYNFFPKWALILTALAALLISVVYLLGKLKKIWIFFFVAGILLAIFVIYFINLENFGKLKHILRHPPIPKTIYFLGYLFFGINEWVGDFIQFIFLCLSGMYVGRMVSLLSPQKERFSFLSGFSITVFFPTFFHWTNFCGLTGGEIFFLAASFFYFLKYIESQKEEDFFYSMGILGIGLLYERRLLFFFLFALFYLAIKKRFSFSLLRYTALPLILGIPFIVSFPYKSGILAFWWIKQPYLLLVGVKQIYWALGPILTFLSIVSLFFSLKERKALLFILFFFLYYFFISSTLAVGCLRHSQPYYLSLCILISFLITKTKPIFLLATLLIMLYQGIFSNSPSLITLSNYKSSNWEGTTFGILPYKAALAYIKEEMPNKKIYAPMGCEPSHFYLAKFGIREELWIRKPFLKGFSLSSLHQFCQENGIKYIILPNPNPLFKGFIDIELASSIYKGEGKFKIKKRFYFGENSLFLFEVL
jgi:hypothetical protein